MYMCCAVFTVVQAEVRAEAEKERGDLQQKLEDCTKQLKKREKRVRVASLTKVCV